MVAIVSKVFAMPLNVDLTFSTSPNCFILIKKQLKLNEKCLLFFDPSHINKSGKKTYGLGSFWSGKDLRSKKGLEIGCLAMVDVA